jgi:hypothetical protein
MLMLPAHMHTLSPWLLPAGGESSALPTSFMGRMADLLRAALRQPRRRHQKPPQEQQQRQQQQRQQQQRQQQQGLTRPSSM